MLWFHNRQRRTDFSGIVGHGKSSSTVTTNDRQRRTDFLGIVGPTSLAGAVNVGRISQVLWAVPVLNTKTFTFIRQRRTDFSGIVGVALPHDAFDSVNRQRRTDFSGIVDTLTILPI